MKTLTKPLNLTTLALLICTGAHAQTGIDTTGTILVVNNDGSDVWNQSGSSVIAVNNQTGTPATLVNSSKLANSGNYYNPSFSPDGRSICFSASVNGQNSIFIANNDGSGIQKICDSYHNTGVRVNWCTDGYIWWSEMTSDIYRVSLSSKTREDYWSNCPAQGHDNVVVEALTVSIDGTRGESNGNGQVNSINLTGKTIVTHPVGGCAGAITSDGKYMLIQGTSPTTPGSSGGFNGTWVMDFTTGAQVTYVNLPGSSQAYFHSSSKNNPDFFTARSLAGTFLGGAILVKISSKQSKAPKPGSGAWIPSDFWCGPLPTTSTTPVIALNKTLLTFTASGTNPASQTVTVSNAGPGTLTAVTTAKKNAWLTVTVSGSGNSQTLTNAVSISSLADGPYHDTVTVSGGGASNSVKYAVNLTVGSAPASPSNLVATAQPGVMSSSVTLTWTDNSANETSFIIERQKASGAWTQVATVNANVVTYTDTGLAADQYAYRVSAKNSTGTSASSNQAAITVTLQPKVTVTGPLPPTQLRVGDTAYISWTALNMTSVTIAYSIDDGLSFTMVPGITGQLPPTDPRWNHFPWKVPSSPTGTVYIRVASYVNHDVFDTRGPYTLIPVATAYAKPAARQQTMHVRGTALRSIANAQSLDGRLHADTPLRIVRLNGASVGRVNEQARMEQDLSAGRFVGTEK